MNALNSQALFDMSHTLAAPLLENCREPWLVLPQLKQFIIQLGATLDRSLYDNPQENVWIAKTAVVAPSAVITAPAIIGGATEIRHCAYLRGATLIGSSCVVGNSCELKNCIIFDNVQIPHFNYVGDSILGYRAHLGAGAVTSNVKSDRTLVTINYRGKKLETGLKKLGALLGDSVEIGCNSVLNPGTIIGRGSRIYPLSCVRGYIPPNSILKSNGNVTPIN